MPPTTRAGPSSELRCNGCGRLVRGDDARCPSCGAVLARTGETPVAALGSDFESETGSSGLEMEGPASRRKPGDGGAGKAREVPSPATDGNAPGTRRVLSMTGRDLDGDSDAGDTELP